MSGRDLDPVEVARDMLRAALPGFETRIQDAADQIEIRGGLPIKATLSSEVICYMVPRPDGFEGDPIYRDFKEVFATEDERAREARHAEQRTALQHVVAPAVEKIVEEIQRFAIEAVSLEPVIAAREAAAEERGRRAGYAAGRGAGRREGRAELLLEWQEALGPLREMLDELGGQDDE